MSGYLTRPAGDPATPVDLSRVPDADLEREIKRVRVGGESVIAGEGTLYI